MTNEEILKKLQTNYGQCPYCGSKSLYGDDYDPTEEDDGIMMTFEPHMGCEDCHAYWDEVYTLTAVRHTKEEDEAEE